ncbi:MAG: hypothetical protein M3024_06350 [Candidatus Dormibacteraeota bacterium]|nr:hypothetical protein [Candidatus Dormibacteraeota bacterium]
MPRRTTRLVGILAAVRRVAPAATPVLLAVVTLSACGALEPVPQVAATPTPTQIADPNSAPSWLENLTFGGDLRGTLNQVTAGENGMRTACTGPRGRAMQAYVLTVFGPVGKSVYGVQLTVNQYRGPGQYSAPLAGAQVFRPDNSAGWRAVDGDSVTVSVGPDEQSGQVQASLTNLGNNNSKLKLKGNWACGA